MAKSGVKIEKPEKTNGVLMCLDCQGYGHWPHPIPPLSLKEAMDEEAKKIREVEFKLDSSIPSLKFCKTCEGKGYFPDLTQEDEKEFMRAVCCTYEYIGSDLESSSEGRITKAGVIEAVLDADYMETYAGDRHLVRSDNGLSSQRIRQIKSLYPYKIPQKLARKALQGYF